MRSLRNLIIYALGLGVILTPLAAQFSSTAYHIGYGASLPATCNPNTADIFTTFVSNTSATPYFCSAPNTWSAFGTGSGSGTVSAGLATQVAKYAANGTTISGSTILLETGSQVTVKDFPLVQTASGIATNLYQDNDSIRCLEGDELGQRGACEFWSARISNNQRFFDLTNTFLNWGDPLGAGSANRVGIGRFGSDGATATTVHTADSNNGTHIDLTTNGIRIVVANSSSPGTTKNSLVKIPAGQASVLTTSAADVISAVGVVLDGAGTTGSAQIGLLGQFACNFDNTATTAGDFITPSSATAGTCHDAGASFPGTGEVLGQVLSTHSACGSPPCGPYTVAFNTPDITLPGSGGSNGNNGGGGGNGAKQQLWSYDCVMGSALGTTVLATGDTGCYFPVGARSGSINRIDIIGNAASLATCSITIDIWLANAAYPTSSDKISASAPLTLSSAKVANNGSTSGWTTAVASGRVFGSSIASITGCVYAAFSVSFQ